MSIHIRIPTPFRPLTGGQDQVTIEAATVSAALDALEEKHPGLKARICDSTGDLRGFINLYINETEVRDLGGLRADLKVGDTISIIPAIAGGVITYQEILNRAKQAQREIPPLEVKKKIDSGEKIVLLDVRESDEYRNGSIARALHLPRGFLEMKVETLLPDRNIPVIVYCAGGIRSLLAAETLSRMGYTQVYSMIGGMMKWTQDGFPTERPGATLSENHQRRYARHLSIPEIGEAGQKKLLASRVLMVGAGGLGCPASYYLAAAGVGTLGIVDFDVVDESNLQRQILHATDRVGTAKIDSAKRTLTAFNPFIKIVGFEERLHSFNVEKIFKDFEIIIDGSDNFPTRYLINDACVHLKKPCVHGSVYRFDGQVSVFDPQRGGPCYRCLYPEPPPPGLAPSCAEAGVLGVLPGVIGLLQAVEAIKLILGLGDPLIGRLLAYDAIAAKFREFKLQRDPGCNYCGESKSFPGYIDYEVFCSNPTGSP